MLTFNRQIVDFILRRVVNVALLEKSISFRFAEMVEDYLKVRFFRNAKEVQLAYRDAVLVAFQWFAEVLVDVYMGTRKEIGFAFNSLTQGILMEQVGVGQFAPPTRAEARKIVNSLLKEGSYKAEHSLLIKKGQKKAVNAFINGLAAGETPSQITKRVAATGIPARSAKTLVRSELMRINNSSLDQLYTDNKDLLAGQQYKATLDTRTCMICAPNDGEVGWYHPGEGQKPISSLEQPPMHLNCRCTLLPVVRDIKDIAAELGISPDAFPPGARKTVSGQLADVKSYRQWIKEQPKITQLAILGPTRYTLFTQGVGIEKFVVGNRTLTMDELSKLKPGEVGKVPEIKPKQKDKIRTKTSEGIISSEPTTLLKKPGVEIVAPKETIDKIKVALKKEPKPVKWVKANTVLDVKRNFRILNLADNFAAYKFPAQEAVDYANMLGEEWARMLNAHPKLSTVMRQNRMKKIDAVNQIFLKGNNEYAAVAGRYFTRDLRIELASGSYSKAYATNKLGWKDWVVDKSKTGVFRHEVGHHYHMTALPERAREEWRSLLLRKYSLTSTGKFRGMAADISKYSGSNEWEAFAESFCAYTNQDYDGGLPSEIHSFMRKWVDGITGT